MTPPATTEPVSADVAAVQRIVEELEPLDDQARVRVLNFLVSKYREPRGGRTPQPPRMQEQHPGQS